MVTQVDAEEVVTNTDPLQEGKADHDDRPTALDVSQGKNNPTAAPDNSSSFHMHNINMNQGMNEMEMNAMLMMHQQRQQQIQAQQQQQAMMMQMMMGSQGGQGMMGGRNMGDDELQYDARTVDDEPHGRTDDDAGCQSHDANGDGRRWWHGSE